MGAFSGFRDKKKSKQETPTVEAYYNGLARKASLVRYAVLIFAVVFAVYSFSFHPNEITIENFEYMMKFLNVNEEENTHAGSLIAFETGESVTYGLYNAQERGILFIGAGEKVYSGMVIGQNAKTDDIEVNICKTKHLTNTRSSGADEALRLTPPKILSLEEALDFIDTDELLEVTPKTLRIRKKILDPKMRKRSTFNK